MTLRIQKSNPNKPPRIMIYGTEGCGKTTFGARADDPIFITPEGGADLVTDKHGNPMSVDQVGGISSWSDLTSAVQSLIKEDHEYKTLVLDSADWIEGLCHKEIIGSSSKSISTVNGGYGAGYREAQSMHVGLINLLSELRDKRNMAIVITAHAHVKTVKDPEAISDYDAFEIKCHEYVSSLWREWVDCLLFVRFKTYVKAGDTDKARAVGGDERCAYTVKRPAYQAKNRYKLPSEMDFTEDFWTELKKFTNRGAFPVSHTEIINDTESVYGKIDADTLVKVKETVAGAGRDIQKLNAIKARIENIIGEKI